MKEIINKEKNADLANSNGLMVANILETSLIIIFTAKEIILGAIKEYIKGIGKTIRWMAKENFYGLTVENMLEDIEMIRKKDMEYSNGKFLFIY